MCRTHAGLYRDGKRLCGPCWLKADEAQAAIAKEQAAQAERQRLEERQVRHQRVLSDLSGKEQAAEAERRRLEERQARHQRVLSDLPGKEQAAEAERRRLEERQARHQRVLSDLPGKEQAAEAERRRLEERQAWRQRVLGDLAGAEPVERLLRVVGRFCACRYGNPRRTEVDVAAINELLGSPAWTVAQVTKWFCRRVTGSPQGEIETFRKTLSGRDKYSKIAAWTFREASATERSVYDSMIFDSIAIAKDGRVFARAEHSSRYWTPLEAWRGDKNLNFSYYGLLLVFEASGLQPVESPPGRI